MCTHTSSINIVTQHQKASDLLYLCKLQKRICDDKASDVCSLQFHIPKISSSVPRKYVENQDRSRRGCRRWWVSHLFNQKHWGNRPFRSLKSIPFLLQRSVRRFPWESMSVLCRLPRTKVCFDVVSHLFNQIIEETRPLCSLNQLHWCNEVQGNLFAESTPCWFLSTPLDSVGVLCLFHFRGNRLRHLLRSKIIMVFHKGYGSAQWNTCARQSDVLLLCSMEWVSVLSHWTSLYGHLLGI